MFSSLIPTCPIKIAVAWLDAHVSDRQQVSGMDSFSAAGDQHMVVSVNIPLFFLIVMSKLRRMGWNDFKILYSALQLTNATSYFAPGVTYLVICEHVMKKEPIAIII